MLSLVLLNINSIKIYTFQHEKNQFYKSKNNLNSNLNLNSLKLQNNINKVNIEINYGQNSIKIPEIINDKFDKTNNINVKYGFYRETKIYKVDGFYEFSNEYLNLNINSSYLNILNKRKNEFTQESWCLSFGLNNGNVIDLDSYLFDNILLSHSSSFDFNRVDIEQNSLFANEQKIIKRFDEKLTLGQSLESGIYFTLNSNVKFKIAYQDKLINDNTKILNMFLPLGIDYLILNIPTYYKNELINELGNNYPYLLFIFRNTYSYFVYTLRNRNGNFPLNSNNTLRYNGVSLGFSLYFDN